MAVDGRLRLDEVERRVCDIASEQLGIRRDRISPGDRIVEDLRCDSLDLVELFMEVEQAFGVTLPDDSPNPVFKAVFTRQASASPTSPNWSISAGDGHARAEGLASGEGAAADADRPSRSPNWTGGGSVEPPTSSGSSNRWRPPGRCPSTAGDPTACGAC